MADPNDRIPFNGINGSTGQYGLALSPDELVQLIQGEEKPANLRELEMKKAEPFPLRPDLDAGDLSQAGWGVIFHQDADPAIQEALGQLLALRQEQAGDYFRIFAGEDDGYRSGDSKNDFLSRHGVGPGLVDPDNGVPYYLLIVGSPAEIPYDFQYQLDVQFAVGRIHFETQAEYANYAASVYAAETGGVKLARRAAFFGVANQDDRATQLSEEHLVTPLIEKINSQNTRLAKQGLEWQIEPYLGDAASKKQLSSLLNGDQPPALLFTASHGMEFHPDDSRQIPHQGALLCQDWPGPIDHSGPLSQELYFAGDDINSDANMLGLISFFFACYGAGTPQFNEFAKNKANPDQIAPRPFLAHLPLKMMGLAKGGALAAVGHVERAWGHSIIWSGAGRSITSFDVAMRQLIRGQPVGLAIEAFDLRYAELASELTMMIDRREKDSYKLAGTWTAHNDARSYIILGDPAARIPTAQKGETPVARPVIKVAPPSKPLTTSASTAESRSDQTATASGADVDYGLREMFDQTQENVVESLKGLTTQLGQFLKTALEDAGSLEISTYTSEDVAGVSYQGGKFVGPAQLRAKTIIKIDGDTDVLVPLDEGEVDQELWAVHLEAVKQAQISRNELLKTAITALSSLIPNVPGT